MLLLSTLRPEIPAKGELRQDVSRVTILFVLDATVEYRVFVLVLVGNGF